MAVLRAAGNLKSAQPNSEELELILRAIVDVNLCKFLSHDVPLFRSILADLFPGIPPPAPEHGHLTRSLAARCTAANLQATEYFILKSIQLYEMIVVRHGLMLVGRPHSGKSCSLQMLAGALTDLKEAGIDGPLFEAVQIRTINPKAVTMGQLYGESDRATQEWKDGVLGLTFRQLAVDQSPDRKWWVSGTLGPCSHA
jgi:dynein heavy chain, axonemal